MPKRPASTPFDTLVRILAQRSHASSELIRKLRQRGYETSEIEAAMERAKELHLLEDEADIAQRYARELAQKKRATPRWVHHKLRSRGLPESETRQAVAEAFMDWDARTAALQAAKDDTNATRVAQRLQRWGFDADAVRFAIENLPRGEPE